MINYINLSTIGVVVENVTLTLNASASNPEGVDYTQYWTNSGDFNDTGSTTGEAPLFWRDDITTDYSGRWNYDTSGGGTAQFDSANERVYSQSTVALTCQGPVSDSVSESSFLNSDDLTMTDSTTGDKRWDYDFYIGASATEHSGSGSFASGVGQSYLYLINGDGDSELIFRCRCVGSACMYDCAKSCSFQSSCGNSYSGTVSFREKINGDYEVYKDGVLKDTITPPSGDVEVKMASSASAGCTVYSGYTRSASGQGESRISWIKQGGFGNNYSDSSDEYSLGSFELISDLIFNTSNTTDSSLDIQSATATYKTYEPTGCDLRLYLNANGTTNPAWQEFTNGLFTEFSTTGPNLTYKINASVTSQNDVDPCALSNLNILVSTDYVANITAYWGDSTSNSYEYTSGDLNETNTPLTISINYTDLNAYLASSDDCPGMTCAVPLKIQVESGTSGQLEVYNISINQSLDGITIPTSPVNTSFGSCPNLTAKCNITNQVNDSNGTITFSDLALQFLGNENITVNASAWNQTGGSTSTTIDMIIRYTPLSLVFTQSLIEDLYFNPWSNNLKNVSPYGQYIGQHYNRSIMNLTTTAPVHEADIYLSHNSTDTIWTNTGDNYTVLYIINQTNKYTATNISLNGTRQVFVQNLSDSEYQPIWMLLDLYNVTSLPWFDWYNWFESYCSDAGDGYGACVVID